MYLSDIKIEGYRLFKDRQILHLRKGLNVLVGENGCGKSTVIDAIRLLLNEDEYARSGISEEDLMKQMTYNGTIYTNRLEGVEKISAAMQKMGFTSGNPDFDTIIFDNVNRDKE